MRWIFCTLAFFNIVAFAWGLVAGSGPQVRPDKVLSANPYARFPELVLLREIEGSGQGATVVEIDRRSTSITSDDEKKRSSVNGVGLASVPMEDAKGRPLCELVGPFETREVARDFVQRLAAIEVLSELHDLELPAGPGYWVYLRPEINRAAALRSLNELQAKRIDSYVIPKGDLENGISLGMFSRKALSDARVKEMKAVGLDPLVEEVERSYRELWVMLNVGEGAKMSSLSWERAMEGIKMLERRQNYCLDVAS